MDNQVKKATAIDEMREMIHKSLLHYSKIEGGYAHIDYDTGWEENIQKLKDIYGQSYERRFD